MAEVQRRERPILFSGPMVRALLDGKKTQTRRIVKWPPWISEAHKVQLGAMRPATGLAEYEDGRPVRRFPCPYGVPGDRLWVKESIRRGPSLDSRRYEYVDTADYVADGAPTALDNWPWKRGVLPSIHMPRGLSRITLEVVDVRVHQLNFITEDDARAEGVDGTGPVGYIPAKVSMGYCRYDFARLWGEINGEESWESNPWVWAVTFKRVRT